MGTDLIMGCKEALVAAGPVLNEMAKKSGARVIPADSEHVAASILFDQTGEKVRTLVLTGTGGALRDLDGWERERAGIDQVLRHPVWQMGPKITVDSATLVNKAMEVIEAAWLFGLTGDQIEVLIDREGNAHAAVGLDGGEWRVHVGDPSMELVAAHVLAGQAWGRVGAGDAAKRLIDAMKAPSRDSCASLGYQVLNLGWPQAAAVFTGADQAVVDAFLSGSIQFGMIRPALESVLDTDFSFDGPMTQDTVIDAYQAGYGVAVGWVERAVATGGGGPGKAG